MLSDPRTQQRLYSLDYYYRNRSKCLQDGKSYRSANLEKERARCRKYSALHPEKAKARSKKWASENPDRLKEMHRRWCQKNPDKVKAKQNRYNGTVKAKQKDKRYYAFDPERRRAQWRASQNKYAKERAAKRWAKYLTDPVFNVNIKVRRMIWGALDKAKKGLRKPDRTIRILGCSFADYRIYLESRFADGMTWEALLDGRLQIDHIRPVASFDLTNPEQVKKCFHFSNTQPLWKADNLAKRDKISSIYGNVTN